MKTRFIVFTVLLSVIVPEILFGQPTTFVTYYGGVLWDYARSVKTSTTGDGYYIAGTTRSAGDYSMLLLKIDPQGDLLWSKKYRSGNEVSDANNICVNDSCLYLAGTYQPYSTWDGILLNAGTDGVVNWSRTFNDTMDNNDYVKSMVITSDGGVVTVSNVNLNNDNLLVAKHTENGALVWSHLYSINGGSIVPWKIIQTMDNSFVVTGRTIIGGDIHGFILKLSQDGNVVWSKTLPWVDHVVGVQQLDTNEYVFCAFDGSYNGVNDTLANGHNVIFVFKTDTNGYIMWSRSFYNNAYHDEFYPTDIVKTMDASVAICGYMAVINNKFDAFIMKIKETGVLLWAKSYGGSENDAIFSIDNGIGGDGFIITGESYSFTHGYNDVFILKTDNFGNTYCGIENDLVLYSFDESSVLNNTLIPMNGHTIDTNSFYHNIVTLDYSEYCMTSFYDNYKNQTSTKIFPTFVNDIITIETTNEIRSIEIINIFGQTISKVMGLINNSIDIDMSEYSPNMYFIRVVNEDRTIETYKVVKN